MTRHVLAWLIVAQPLALGCGSTQEPAVTEAAAPGTDLNYAEREGKALFDHYCTTCHGTGGLGDGFNAYGLDPKPRDLANGDFQAARGDDDLAHVIREGGAASGLSTGMPPWGPVLGERKVGYLVRYLRRLPERSQRDE